MRTLLLALLLVACAGCREPVTARLSVERAGWDTLRVGVLVSGGAAGETRRVPPESLAVRVFDASYDTLYAGPGAAVPVPDARLGDREALLVEACFPVEAARACEQEALAASPKRVRGSVEVSFPQGSDYRRGGYRADVTAERERFEGGGWEPIDLPPALETYLVATVSGAPDGEGGAVRVPVRPGEGRFDLARADGHGDFVYRLRSRLYDARRADVRFELRGSLGRETTTLAADEALVREMTRDDRAAELAVFVEQAANVLIDRLGVFEAARVYIDDWAFDEVLGAYTAEVEVVGRSRGRGFFDRYDRDRLRGALRVREDGDRAVFTLEAATRDVEDAWRESVGDVTLRLPDLEPSWEQELDDAEPVDAEPAAPGVAVPETAAPVPGAAR